jgi:hypothetical protein
MTRWGILSACVLAPALAVAHSNLVNPVPRAGEDIKTAPCGAAPATPVATYNPGDMVMIEWEETIDHPGHYRLTLSPDGIDGFPQIIVEDNIPDIDGAVPAGGRQFSRMEMIPNHVCDRCTLQLVQSMEENPAAPTYYYSCADIRIGASAGGDGGGGGTGDGGGGGHGDAAPGSDEDSSMIGPTPGVCAIALGHARDSGAGFPGAGILGILLGVVVFRPRIGARVSKRRGRQR